MLTNELKQLLQQAIESLTGEAIENLHLEPAAEAQFGDFSTNTAMALSKKLQKKPREIAEELIKAISENKTIEKTEIAGPGFINFWLTDETYNKAFANLAQEIQAERFGHLSLGKGKTAITDSSHPNVAKPMGVHHLLSTIIGSSLNKLLKRGGYTVIKDNYLGDWGTQFGKLTYAIQTWGDMENIKKDPIPELLKLYVKYHEESEKNPDLDDKGRENFKKLEEGDAELKELWKWICDISLETFQEIWERLGVSFDMIHGESYYEDKMETVLKEGKEKGLIEEGEKGALIVKMDDPESPPCLVQKSDGATTYATRDLARIKDWEENYDCDLGIVMVDVAQTLHHDQVHEAAEKIWGKRAEHVRVHFGRMSFPDGSMSTRKGKVVLLEDVLDEAEKRALEKIQEHDSQLPEDEQKELARKIGIGAVKYNVLSQNRNKNYTFDWDVMLSFDGNSAPYLQYAYTRTQSLLRKSEASSAEDASSDWSLNTAEEKTLFKKLLLFEPALERSLTDYKPNHLCTYLFELAQAFSTFYNNLRILDSEPAEKATRLQLVQQTAYVLKDGLAVLGIEVPQRM